MRAGKVFRYAVDEGNVSHHNQAIGIGLTHMLDESLFILVEKVAL